MWKRVILEMDSIINRAKKIETGVTLVMDSIINQTEESVSFNSRE
jgi:hypothetical protein